MALNKKFIVENGIETNYHVIVNINYQKIDKRIILMVASYKSKEYRDAGLHNYIAPIKTFEFDTTEMTDSINFNILYALLKSTSDFVDAIDILENGNIQE